MDISYKKRIFQEFSTSTEIRILFTRTYEHGYKITSDSGSQTQLVSFSISSMDQIPQQLVKHRRTEIVGMITDQ